MHSLANTEDEELFTQIVEKLCSLATLEEMEETIDDLEKALESSPHCKNTPFFSVVKGEIMDIDFYFQPIIDTSYLFDIRYRAEYYDGYIPHGRNDLLPTHAAEAFCMHSSPASAPSILLPPVSWENS